MPDEDGRGRGCGGRRTEEGLPDSDRVRRLPLRAQVPVIGRVGFPVPPGVVGDDVQGVAELEKREKKGEMRMERKNWMERKTHTPLSPLSFFSTHVPRHQRPRQRGVPRPMATKQDGGTWGAR